MTKRILVGLLLLAIVTALTATLALRDNPARPPAGESRIATNGDTRIEYIVAGPDNGTPVILLASYARSVSDFNELAGELHRAGYRTIGMQARGVDGSDLPSLRASLFDYADDLAAVLRSEALNNPVVVIGHAFGNRIARAFASRYPQAVNSLILLSAGDSSPPPDTSANVMTAVFQLWPEPSRRQALQQAFFADHQQAPDYWLRGWYPRAALAQAYATANTAAGEWTGAGQTPMLVIQADQDVAAPAAGQRLKRQYPQRVTLVKLAGAGHATLPEQPERVAAVVLQQLARDE